MAVTMAVAMTRCLLVTLLLFTAACTEGRPAPGPLPHDVGAEKDRTSKLDKTVKADRTGVPDKVAQPDSMVCTFDTFCKMLKPGYACCCFDESNWHPCCPAKCSAIVVHACEAATGKCLDFCSSCLPPGWTPTKM